MSAETFWQSQHDATIRNGEQGILRRDYYTSTSVFLQQLATQYSKIFATQQGNEDTLQVFAGFCNRLETAQCDNLHIYLFGVDNTNLSLLIRQEPADFIESAQPRDMIKDIQQNSIGPNTLFFSFDTKTNLPLFIARSNDETVYKNTTWPHVSAVDYQLNHLSPVQRIQIGELLIGTIFAYPDAQIEPIQPALPDLPNSFIMYMDTMEIIDVGKTEPRSAPIAKVVKSSATEITTEPTLCVIRQQGPQLMQKVIWRIGARLYMCDIDSNISHHLLENSITFIGKIPIVIRPFATP